MLTPELFNVQRWRFSYDYPKMKILRRLREKKEANILCILVNSNLSYKRVLNYPC